MLEFDLLMLPLDDNVQQALKAKVGDGWMLVPGTTPRVVYQVCRPLQAHPAQTDANQGFGVLRIDESQIHIVDKDGNKVERH